MSSERQMPTPYELARIAAALRGQTAGEKPEEATKEALGLWCAACGTIEGAIQDAEDQLAAQAMLPEPMAPSPGIAFGTNWKDSAAISWLEKNAKDKRDKFATFGKFERAWAKVFGANASAIGSEISEPGLRMFLRKRLEARRRQDAKIKRQMRKKKGPGRTVSN
jgi:hypothetical protein